MKENMNEHIVELVAASALQASRCLSSAAALTWKGFMQIHCPGWL